MAQNEIVLSNLVFANRLQGNTMAKLTVFNQISLDGYFTDTQEDMSWAHKAPDDVEWAEFVNSNAQGGGSLLFGRVTYEMMASFWPTPVAAERMPIVAERMNRLQKFVFSRSLSEATWSNTTLIKGELADEVRRLKQDSSNDITILGSGSIVAQLSAERLIDAYQLVLCPLALGGGRSLFEGLPSRLDLRLLETRVFNNGSVVLTYEPK